MCSERTLPLLDAISVATLLSPRHKGSLAAQWDSRASSIGALALGWVEIGTVWYNSDRHYRANDFPER